MSPKHDFIIIMSQGNPHIEKPPHSCLPVCLECRDRDLASDPYIPKDQNHRTSEEVDLVVEDFVEKLNEGIKLDGNKVSAPSILPPSTKGPIKVTIRDENGVCLLCPHFDSDSESESDSSSLTISPVLQKFEETEAKLESAFSMSKLGRNRNPDTSQPQHDKQTVKPQRRKKLANDDDEQPGTSSLALEKLEKQLEFELGYLTQPRNYSTFPGRNSVVVVETAGVMRARNSSNPKGLKEMNQRIFNDETLAYRKLSNQSRILLVDEDTRFEDELEFHAQALEKRLTRDNTSAMNFFEDEEETRVETPVGFEYSDRVLKRRHRIAWELAAASPMVKNGIVETSIPIAATQYYTRKISFWTRVCSRFKLCFTCVWMTPTTDLEVDSGLLTSESIEAFQQEINIMEFLGAQHARTLERRQSLVATDSVQRMIKSFGDEICKDKESSQRPTNKRKSVVEGGDVSIE